MAGSYTLKHASKPLKLGPELARGGEGAIYPVDGDPSLVAKVYLRPPEPTKVAKLEAMAACASPELLKIAAWPKDLVLEKGRIQGFVMPRIGSRSDAHELYSPRSRAVTFPEADFRFLSHVAANVARAFATVHAAGHVIGDVNHGHMLVGTDGRVVLIDADSFQIASGGRLHTCDVGVPLFTAPELQGQGFRGLHRTVNHDCFGLAVMLFHFLFMGRHPFAGVWSGAGDMPIEKAIAERRFAYGAKASSAGMKPPPATLPLSALGPEVAGLFEQAFAPGEPSRPSAAAWVTALEKLKSGLRPCGTEPSHHQPAAAASCPWCAIERGTGVRLFGRKIALGAVGNTGSVDVGTLWAAIARVPQPPPDPELPSAKPWTPPPGIEMPDRSGKVARQIASIVLGAGGLAGCAGAIAPEGGAFLGLVGFGMAFAVWPRVASAKRAEAEREFAAARNAWTELETRWTQEASVARFSAERSALEKARADYADLPRFEAAKMAELKAGLQQAQKRRFLDRFRIDRASVSGIGPGRAATLASFGIETAWDVSRGSVGRVPGFGPKLTSTLIDWRLAQEAKFRFNPAEPVDPRDVARVKVDIADRTRRLLAMLREGPTTLQRRSSEIVAARTRLAPHLKDAWDKVKLAEARRNAL